MTKPHHLHGAFLALMAFGFYATHDVVVKFLGGAYTTFQITFFSSLFGIPLVTLMLLADRSSGTLIPRHPFWMALRSFSALVTGLTAFFAFARLPLAQTYAILFATPLLITLIAVPFLGERIGLRRGLAVAAGLLGVLIVLRPGVAPFGLGHAAALSAVFTGALTSILMRKIGPVERTAVLMLYPMMLTVAAMALVMPAVYRPMPLAHLGLLGLMSGLGVLGALSFIAAYRRAPAAIVAPMQYSQILWASLYGWLFFGETPDRYTGLGAAVIVASGLYIVLREETPRVSKLRPVLTSRPRLDAEN